MSVLPCATYAGPKQDEALWAVAGSTGGGSGGVTQLLAGDNITLTPSDGLGVVTITAAGGGGGGGGVSSVTASGPGISATPTTGAVVLANTGVTSLVAGTGISLSGNSGAVTVTNTYAAGQPTLTYSVLDATTAYTPVSTDTVLVTLALQTLTDNVTFQSVIWKSGWSTNDVFIASLVAGPVVSGARIPGTLMAQAVAASGGAPDRLGIFFTAVSDITTGSRPQVWITRYAGNRV